MTNVIQCDKCKRVFEKGHEVDYDNCVRIIHYVKIDGPPQYCLVNDWDENARLHICHDCLKELYSWLGYVNTDKQVRDTFRKNQEELHKNQGGQSDKKKRKLF